MKNWFMDLRQAIYFRLWIWKTNAELRKQDRERIRFSKHIIANCTKPNCPNCDFESETY